MRLCSIHIPPRGQELILSELPISVRLDHLFQRMQITRLGQLDGLTWHELTQVRYCGSKTAGELDCLIKRVKRGEFDLEPETFSPGQYAGLFRYLDELLKRLPAHKCQVLQLRLGSEGGRALNRKELGLRYHCSHTRIGQIETEALMRLRQEGGPKLAHHLQDLSALCAERVMPLTMPLLVQWLGKPSSELGLPRAAYLRLLGLLHPLIPVWPEGQAPVRQTHGLEQEIVSAMEQILVGQPQGLTTKVSYQLLRAQAKLRTLSVVDFLAAIRRARLLSVDFIEPTEPKICLIPLPAKKIAPAEVARAIPDV